MKGYPCELLWCQTAERIYDALWDLHLVSHPPVEPFAEIHIPLWVNGHGTGLDQYFGGLSLLSS